MINFTDALIGLEQITSNHKKKHVSKSDYELFCKEFTFEKIKGISFGEAFCRRFDFNDLFLKNLSDSTAKFHIEHLGYVK